MGWEGDESSRKKENLFLIWNIKSVFFTRFLNFETHLVYFSYLNQILGKTQLI